MNDGLWTGRSKINRAAGAPGEEDVLKEITGEVEGFEWKLELPDGGTPEQTVKVLVDVVSCVVDAMGIMLIKKQAKYIAEGRRK